MPPRAILPRLTLYTGGPECSLCEVAKQQLKIARLQQDFQLDLFNIRYPSEDADLREVKKWRRLYQYDIPVLHLEGRRIQKHRIDVPSLLKSIEEWKKSQFQAAQEDINLTRDDQPRKRPRLEDRPWRRKVGQVWFSLNSSAGVDFGENVPHDEEESFGSLVEGMFENMLDINEWPLEPSPATQNMDITLDNEPERGVLEGDSEIMYDRDQSDEVKKPGRPTQICWNCREPGHLIAECPKPRNAVQIKASRDQFNAQKDAMPESARTFLESCRFTLVERTRRLDLVQRFKPGLVTKELEDAMFWIDDEGMAEYELEDGEMEHREIEEEMMDLKRRNKEYPWLDRMLVWGYPPGWIAGRDPQEECRRRIKVASIQEDETYDSDDDSQLYFIDEQAEPASKPPSPPPPPPPPPDEPPPLPPRNNIFPNNSMKPKISYPVPVRWAIYETKLFSSERLLPYSEVKPVPLGFRV